eukprot:752302-Hanusia_phi.AAC.4
MLPSEFTAPQTRLGHYHRVFLRSVRVALPQPGMFDSCDPYGDDELANRAYWRRKCPPDAPEYFEHEYADTILRDLEIDRFLVYEYVSWEEEECYQIVYSIHSGVDMEGFNALYTRLNAQLPPKVKDMGMLDTLEYARWAFVTFIVSDYEDQLDDFCSKHRECPVRGTCNNRLGAAFYWAAYPYGVD